VDPAQGGTKETTITHTFYTIVLMNYAFRKARPQAFPNIAADPACPAELRAALAQNPQVVTAD
jgi:hypothetical protein